MQTLELPPLSPYTLFTENYIVDVAIVSMHMSTTVVLGPPCPREALICDEIVMALHESLVYIVNS